MIAYKKRHLKIETEKIKHRVGFYRLVLIGNKKWSNIMGKNH